MLPIAIKEQLALEGITFVLPSARDLEGKPKDAKNPGFSVIILDPDEAFKESKALPVLYTYPGLHAFDDVKVVREMKESARIAWRDKESSGSAIFREGLVVVVRGKKPEHDALIADWIAAAVCARLRVSKNHHVKKQKQ